MSYTLWSRGRLLGYTELDIRHVQDFVRMGFIEPTEDGKRLLPDATGVPAAVCALARAARRAPDQREVTLGEFADFRAACDRREALDLELRDDVGLVFPCQWIRIHDNDDPSWGDEDVDAGDDEPLELELDLEDDLELDAALEHDAELVDSWLDGDDYGRASSWEPPDDRWETMRYHMMVYLGERA